MHWCRCRQGLLAFASPIPLPTTGPNLDCQLDAGPSTTTIEVSKFSHPLTTHHLYYYYYYAPSPGPRIYAVSLSYPTLHTVPSLTLLFGFMVTVTGKWPPCRFVDMVHRMLGIRGSQPPRPHQSSASYRNPHPSLVSQPTRQSANLLGSWDLWIWGATCPYTV